MSGFDWGDAWHVPCRTTGEVPAVCHAALAGVGVCAKVVLAVGLCAEVVTAVGVPSSCRSEVCKI